ncbi:MAG: MerR family transcriptional regulator [Bacteroidetes bacterium]|nr:MAG: MerR family transcriptional regulator [Bacteroidota bacterium]
MGTYKIKDLEVLTGIKAGTIRMWEKRYGILVPERTETKIRMYNDEELKSLLCISLLNKRGVKISRIAYMSEEEINQVLDSRDEGEDSSELEQQLLLALVELDEHRFMSALHQLIDKEGFEESFSAYLIPFLERIGIMWMVGSINPAQEHLVSNLIRQKLLSSLDQLPIHKKGKKVLLFLPEHELHELSLLFYHYYLRSKGYQTYYLGQCVPYEALVEAVKKIQPEVVLSSWIHGVDKEEIKGYFERLNADLNVRLFAGGSQVEEHLTDLKSVLNPIRSMKDLDFI